MPAVFNFNEQAAALVKSSGAEGIIKAALQSPYQTLHVDETGINIGGKQAMASWCINDLVDLFLSS